MSWSDGAHRVLRLSLWCDLTASYPRRRRRRSSYLRLSGEPERSCRTSTTAMDDRLPHTSGVNHHPHVFQWSAGFQAVDRHGLQKASASCLDRPRRAHGCGRSCPNVLLMYATSILSTGNASRGDVQPVSKSSAKILPVGLSEILL